MKDIFFNLKNLGQSLEITSGDVGRFVMGRFEHGCFCALGCFEFGSFHDGHFVVLSSGKFLMGHFVCASYAQTLSDLCC